jgi:hypothetical protein
MLHLNSRYYCLNIKKSPPGLNPQVPDSSPGRGAKIQKPANESLRAFSFELRYAQISQFSAVTPGYLSKSLKLLVTKVTDNAFEWAAINLSR